MTFTLLDPQRGDPLWPEAITMVEKTNADGGEITAQMFPRPIGLMIGLELSAQTRSCSIPATRRSHTCRWPSASPRCANPKCGNGSWPTSPASTTVNPLMYLAQTWEWIFPLGDNADYEPDRSTASWRARKPAA